jgi:hypothetical protein
MSKNFLLVYEQIPETVDYYLLEDPTEDELRTLRIAHGATLGASENAKKQGATGHGQVSFYKLDYSHTPGKGLGGL